jgi:hypothetical protein
MDDWDDVATTDWPAWATEKAEVRPPDLEWQARGEKERLLLDTSLGAWLVAPIEHVGSAAVPNLLAKPDFGLPGCRRQPRLRGGHRNGHGSCRWHFVPPAVDARAWRRFLVKLAHGHRVAHLHVMLLSNARWGQQLAGTLICQEILTYSSMTSKISLARNALDLALKQDGLDRLDRLKSARDNVELGIQNTVTNLRDDGVTWTEIAASLNVTRQSAQERYGSIRPPD